MRALIHDPAAPAGLRLGESPDPVPGTNEALVALESTSLNWGEVAGLSIRTKPGDVAGWDGAGVVIQPAADGSGPAVGTRVVTFGWMGGWAERRAVTSVDLAIVPDEVALGAASAVTVAGVTPLQALRGLGSVTGRRVLITGASGGVGRLAVQLAALAGAQVVASVRSPERAAGLSDIGASEVVVGLKGLSGPVYGVIDGVGGPQLAEVMTHLEDGAIVQWIGNASREQTGLGAAERAAATWQLHTYRFRTPVGADLAYLMRLLAGQRLDPQIVWRGPWDRASEAAQALMNRQIAGKVVLDLVPSDAKPRWRRRCARRFPIVFV
jgi:NADPH2:quinone reductase